MHINVPTFKILVANRFITDAPDDGFTEAYLVSARVIKSRPILFTVHLENGALYSGLPINALFGCESECHALELEEAQPWSCLEGPANALILGHMKDYQVEVLKADLEGRYLFTIDYHGDGLAQDPEQHKMHHIIETETHCLVAMPNNFCLFDDAYFVKKDMTFQLTRQKKYYRTY